MRKVSAAQHYNIHKKMSSLATAPCSIAARSRVANSRALASTSAPAAAYNPAASSTSRRGARRATITRAEGTEGMPFAIARKAGFDTSEGLAGFTPFAELWVGRTAMGGRALIHK